MIFFTMDIQEADVNSLDVRTHVDPYSGFPAYNSTRCGMRKKVHVEEICNESGYYQVYFLWSLLHRLHGPERFSGKKGQRPFRNVFDLEMEQRKGKIQSFVFSLHAL